MENMKNVSKKRSLELEIFELESKLAPDGGVGGVPIYEGQPQENNPGAEC